MIGVKLSMISVPLWIHMKMSKIVIALVLLLCLVMAGQDRRSREISRLVNEANASGLDQEDENVLEKLISDYFVVDDNNSDTDMDTDDDDDMDTTQTSGSDESDDMDIPTTSAGTSASSGQSCHVADPSPAASARHDVVPELDELEQAQQHNHVDDGEVIIAEAMQIAENRFNIDNDINNDGATCKCKCKSKCIEQFTNEELRSIRDNIREMTSQEKDMVILGILSCSVNTSEEVLHGKRWKKPRQLTRMRAFQYNGKQICRDTFLYLFCMSICKFNAMKKHFLKNGLVPYKKKSGGRTKRALTYDEIKAAVRFISNYAEVHAIMLPGRIPGFKRDDVLVLPSSITKVHVYEQYKVATVKDNANARVIGFSTFKKLWLQLLPFIVICKPMSDLCWQCQQNNNLILRSVNRDEHEKTQALESAQQHLTNANKERDLYRAMCKSSKDAAGQIGLNLLGKNQPKSKSFEFHYSFDFAQQVHYPSDPLQPGPIFFKTPRKCGIFGVNAEGLPSQVNYLIDECVACGKGANVVISLLHHFLENYGIGETDLHLNADNCSGQNKNNYMMWYLAWRVYAGLHNSVSLHFLLAGHTKFFPDWCFGLLKQRYRRNRVSCLQDLVDLVDQSSKVNQPHLCGDERGNVFVPVYDWVSFLSPFFRRFPGLLSYHHFTFRSDDPGLLKVQKLSNSPVEEFNMSRTQPPSTMPPLIRPKGLDDDRKQYLFDHIRPFCTSETQDLVCPKP